MDGIESKKDSVPLRDGQDIVGHEDPILSPPSVEEIPLGQEDSRQEVEQESHPSEPNDQEIRDYVQEARQRASHQDTLDVISGCSSKPQEVSNHHLGFVREHMLLDWYQLVRVLLWLEQRVFNRLKGLMLAPEPESSVDSCVHVDQWALTKSQ